MVISHIWVEPDGAGADLDGLDLAEFTQIVEHLVHSLQGNCWHSVYGGGVDGIGRWMRGVVLKQPEHEFALRG